MKKTTFPLIILLIVALIGGLVLVKQNQETRKGAFFATTKLFLLPSEKIIKNVGDQFQVKVWFLTGGQAKVDGVQTVVCYGDELTLDEAGIVVNTGGGFDSTPIVNFTYNVGTTGRSCATMVATSKQGVDKLTTTGEVFALNFKAVKMGSGTLDINKSKSVVTGDNPQSPTDKEIDVTLVENTTYEIVGSTTNCERCSTLFNYMRVKWTADNCANDPVGLEVIRTYDASCTGVNNPLQCSRCSTINDKEYVWWNREANKTCNDAPTGLTVYRAYREDCNLNQVTPTPPEEECGPDKPCPEGQMCITETRIGPDYSEHNYCVPIDTPVLNYKVTFGGVIVNQDTKCAVDWPLQIIVLSAGETKVFTDTPTAITSKGTLIEYQGSLPLVGFNHLTNVAAFIKGPKHLQMKYAIQDQTARYGSAGGKLTVTTSAETSPLYNFTGYPMLAGDVVGATIKDGPNGEINGVDFAYLKSLSKNVLGEAGTNVNGDLDGNCMITSNDIAIFRISLERKQSELY